MREDNILMIAVLGIAVAAIFAAFFGGFIFGGKNQGVIFDRDDRGRISGIFNVANMVR
jgi:hypothetical protein